MTKKFFAIAAGALLAVSVAAADPVGHGLGYSGGKLDYSRVGNSAFGGFQGNGGEFRLTEDSAGSFNFSLSNYSSMTSGTLGNGKKWFQSFCMETTENIANNAYTWVSTENAAGGSAGSHAYKGSTGIGDDLDSLTAWAYTKFATGTLPGYDYDNNIAGLGRDKSAGALQRLIWNTEGEGGLLTTGNSFQGITLDATQAALISSWITAFGASGFTGIGNVRVLQLIANDGVALRQDQLILIPAPAAALLGLIGLGTAAWAKRRSA